MRTTNIPALLLGATLAVPMPLAAQVPEPAAPRTVHVLPSVPPLPDSAADSVAARPPKPSCWRAQPSPPCRGFFLTEFGVAFPIASKTSAAAPRDSRSDFHERVYWTVGFMGTRGTNSHGGAVSLIGDGATEAGVDYAVEYRYRRWLGRRASLGAGLGVGSMHIWKDENQALARVRALTTSIALTPNRYVGGTIRFDIARSAGRTHSVVMLGASSSWLSEQLFHLVAIAGANWLLGKIGMEVDEDEEDGVAATGRQSRIRYEAPAILH